MYMLMIIYEESFIYYPDPEKFEQRNLPSWQYTSNCTQTLCQFHSNVIKLKQLDEQTNKTIRCLHSLIFRLRACR